MSWNDFMKRLVVGKKRNENFTTQDLPKNRRQVFKFIYKNRLIEQFNAGLLCILFCLPLIAWQIISYSTRRDLNVSSLSELEQFNEYLNLLTTKNIINIPCIMLASVGLAGLVYVIRKLCFNEPISLLKDFGKGIKNSWLQYLIISFILGVNIYIIDNVFNYLIYYPNVSGVLRIGLLVFMLIFNFSMLIVYIYAFAISGLYNTSLLQIFKGAFMLTFKKYFTNLVMFFAGVLPLLVFFIQIFPPIVIVIGAFILIFGGLSFSIIVTSLFVYAQFDKFINEKSYPELVNKGIFTDEDLQDELDDITQDEIDKLAEQIAQSYDEESKE